MLAEESRTGIAERAGRSISHRLCLPLILPLAVSLFAHGPMCCIWLCMRPFFRFCVNACLCTAWVGLAGEGHVCVQHGLSPNSMGLGVNINVMSARSCGLVEHAGITGITGGVIVSPPHIHLFWDDMAGGTPTVNAPGLTVVGVQEHYLVAIRVSLRLQKTRLSILAECTSHHHGDKRSQLTPQLYTTQKGLCYAQNDRPKK